MPSSTATDSYRRRLAICVAALAVSLVLFPLLALVPTVVPMRLPSRLGNALFFWPQYLLLPGGIRAAGATAAYGAGVVPVVAAAFWLAVAAGMARATLRWRKRWALPALFATVAVIGAALLFGLRSAGFAPVLDGL
jgi:hypothetical protein